MKHAHSIQEDLRWLGLGWDGDALFQSERHTKHWEALEGLVAQDKAYRCFCSEHQLSLDRKLAASRGLPPRYTGRCRTLSVNESLQQAKNNPFVWRLAVHADEGEVRVPDALRGDVHFGCRDLDDPVVVRSDGSFTFLLPNAVDDAIDGITHVLRGDDHLTNSAYQVWLLEHLDLNVPMYFHHGLLLGQDGAKLSKRSGGHSVAELREDGLLPAALMQTMGRLGYPNLSEVILKAEELAVCFEAEHISKASVRWSDDELWRWHTHLLHGLSTEDLAALIQPFFPDTDKQCLQAFASLIGPNLNRVEDAKGFKRLLDASAEMDEAAMRILEETGPDFFKEAGDIWSKMDEPDWQAWTKSVKAKTGCKGKALFLPLRVALTGASSGPQMNQVIAFLGKEGTGTHLDDSIRRLSL